MPIATKVLASVKPTKTKDFRLECQTLGIHCSPVNGRKTQFTVSGDADAVYNLMKNPIVRSWQFA